MKLLASATLLCRHSGALARRVLASGGRAALVGAVAIVSLSALIAASTPVYQSGTMTPGSLAKFFTNGQVGEVGGLVGAPGTARGVNPFSVTDGSHPGQASNVPGLGECLNSNITSAAYYAFCLGHDSAGNALLTIDAYGGAPESGFYVRKNGTLYSFPAGGTGNVVGPVSSTTRNLAGYNATTGDLLLDSGIGVASGTGLTVYVATTGADTGNCQTIGSPCLTITYALTQGLKNHVKAGNLVVSLAAGSYAESVFVNQPLWGGANAAPNPNGTNNQPGQVLIQGTGSTTTTLNGGAYCATIGSSAFATVGVRAIKLKGNNEACQSTLFAQINGAINIYDDVDFGDASVEQIHIENAGSAVQAWYSYKISGGALRHVLAAANGLYIHSAYPSGVITLSATPTFSDAFAYASENGTIQFNGNVTFSGTFIGKRYAANQNGVISTFPSVSATWLPGTIAGTVDTGGVYRGPGGAIVAAVATTGGGVTIQPDTTAVTQIVYSSALGSPLSGSSNGAGIYPYMLSNAKGYIDALTGGSGAAELHLRTYLGSGSYGDVLVPAPTGGDTLVGRATSETLTNKALTIPRITSGTFSGLPACASGTGGTIGYITDSTTGTWGATITGGGATKVLALCNGTNWTVAGA